MALFKPTGETFMRCLHLALLLTVGLGGCSSHRATISAAVDPVRTPLKTDRISLVPHEAPSIQERQLELPLREGLCRAGFNIVGPDQNPRWALHFGLNRRVENTGATTRINPFTLLPTAVTHVDQVGITTLSLTASPAAPPPTGPWLTIWEGSTEVTDKVFDVYQPIVIKTLLDQFGKNFKSPVKLSKSELYEAQDAPACLSSNKSPIAASASRWR
jgi:hypothetical protein